MKVSFVKILDMKVDSPVSPIIAQLVEKSFKSIIYLTRIFFREASFNVFWGTVLIPEQLHSPKKSGFSNLNSTFL